MVGLAAGWGDVCQAVEENLEFALEFAHSLGERFTGSAGRLFRPSPDPC